MYICLEKYRYEFEPQYMLVVDRQNNLDILQVQVEVRRDFFSDDLGRMLAMKKTLSDKLKSVLSISADIKLMEPNSISRSEGKSKCMPSISLCMIVKNEERNLPRCLDSVQDLVDEIVIVDTGSSDATRAAALRYTHRVYDFTWRDDFAAARNFSFSKAIFFHGCVSIF